MLLLVLGLLLFLGVHLVPTHPALRNDLRVRFGTNSYRIGFTVLSLIGFALIVYGYGKVQMLPGKNPQLWVPPQWTKHLAWLLMLPALILLAASNIPSRIRSVVGHPMLLGIKIWAVAHLLANGTLAAVVLFSTFLAWAVYDLISVSKRGAMGPLGSTEGTAGGDLAAVAIGTAFWAFMLYWGHTKLIGVALMS